MSNNKRGSILGSALGITEKTVYDIFLEQYVNSGMVIESGTINNNYCYLEVHDPKEKMKKVGQKRTTIIHYFDYEGKNLTETKVLVEVVSEVIIEKNGEYVL